MSESSHCSAGPVSPVLVGVVSLDSTLSSTIMSAVRDADIQAFPIQNVDLSGIGPDNPNIVVMGAKSITSDVLVTVAQATGATARRLLLVAEDHDPQHIADLLRAGADDYLAAPFAPEELVARILSLAARSCAQFEQRKQGPVAFDFPSRTIIAGSTRVTLSRQEWNILLALLEAENQPISVKELSENLPHPVSNGAIITTIARLRRKFRAYGFQAIIIETVYGVGYEARFRRRSDATDSPLRDF